MMNDYGSPVVFCYTLDLLIGQTHLLTSSHDTAMFTKNVGVIETFKRVKTLHFGVVEDVYLRQSRYKL